MNALSRPYALAGGVHTNDSPGPIAVTPGVTATPPLVTLPVTTDSMRNCSVASRATASDEARSAAYVMVKVWSSFAPVSGSMCVTVGWFVTGASTTDTVVAGLDELTPSDTVTVNVKVPLA